MMRYTNRRILYFTSPYRKLDQKRENAFQQHCMVFNMRLGLLCTVSQNISRTHKTFDIVQYNYSKVKTHNNSSSEKLT